MSKLENQKRGGTKKKKRQTVQNNLNNNQKIKKREGYGNPRKSKKPNLEIDHIGHFFDAFLSISLPFLLQYGFLYFWRMIIRSSNSCLISHYHQQGEPFLQLRAPAPTVIEPTREDGLALKLEALA